MSMFHARSDDADPVSGLYKDYYTIHAVDKYGNPVSAGTALHPTLINRSQETGRNGTIFAGVPTHFTGTNFSSVVNNRDRVIVVPSSGKTNKYYFGNWSIKDHNATTLTFDEQYNDVDKNGLTYVVGNENRVINGNSVTADISSLDEKYVTDDKGNLQFVVTYDPLLKGEYYYLAANAQSNGKRIGTALKSSFYYGGYQLKTLISEIYMDSPGSSLQTDHFLLDSIGHKVSPVLYNAKVDNFDTTKGSFSVTNGFNNSILTYTAPLDSKAFNKLIGTTYEFNLTIAEGVEPFQTIKVHYVDHTDYSNYQLVTPENNFTISQADQSQLLHFYLKNGSSTVVNERINIDFIDPIKGTMDKYSSLTNANGEVIFVYTAPSDIASLGNQPINIRASLDRNSSIDVNSTGKFDPTGGKDYTGYGMAVVPMDFNVSAASEKRIIQVYL